MATVAVNCILALSQAHISHSIRLIQDAGFLAVAVDYGFHSQDYALFPEAIMEHLLLLLRLELDWRRIETNVLRI